MPSDFAKNLVKDFVRVYPFEAPIIDIGAGDVFYWYKPIFQGKEYVTVDADPQYRQIVDVIADICFLPKDFKNKFGVVLLLETLEHMQSPLCAFKSAFRILRPGGYLLCTTVACYGEHKHPKDFWRFLPDGLEFLMHQSGFINKGVKMNQPNTTRTAHICCVAQKPNTINEDPNT